MRPLQASVSTAHPGAPLTALERYTLWHLAQGMTYGSLARKRGRHVQTLKAEGARILVKLRAHNMTQAVFLAVDAGIIGRYLDCGTRNAYLRHRRRGESTCMACRLDNAEHSRAQRAGELKRKKES